ncbi:MAG: response regulator [Leptolyngbya sp.]|nr:response regulator [Candidatus Melainabacteria bacterium]
MLAAAGYATYATAQQQENMLLHRRWLIHSYQVLMKLQEIDVQTEELVSSERGYIITEKKQFVADFNRSEKTLREALDAVMELMKDNRPQQKRCEFLIRTIDRRIEYLKEVIATADEEGFDAARDDVKNRGVEVFESESDDILHEIIHSERELLKFRADKLTTETARTSDLSNTLLALAISALILCLLMVSYFFKEKNNVAKRLSLQLAVTQILSENKNIQESFQRLLQVLGTINGFKFGAAWLVSTENAVTELRPIASWKGNGNIYVGFEKQTYEKTFQIGEGLPGRVWEIGAPEIFNLNEIDIAKFPRKPAALEEGLKQGVAFPIFGHNQILGVVEFFNDKSEDFDEEQTQTLASFGHEIGQFIEAVRGREELLERAELSVFVAEIAYVLSQQTNLDELLKQCTSLMVRHMDAAVARIWVVGQEEDDDNRALHLKANSGKAIADTQKPEPLKFGESEVGVIAEQVKPIFADDITSVRELANRDWIKNEGITAMAGYPLVFGTDLLGVMVMYCKEKISLRKLEALSGIANGIALGIQRNISDKKLEEREFLFRTLTEQIREVFMIIKPDNTFIYISPAFEEVWGRPISEVYQNATRLFEGIHPEDIQLVQNFVERTKSEKAPAEVEHRIIRPDGSIRWIWARTFPSIGEDGEIERIYSIGHDITDRKEAETRVSEFYSTVSHELRTPLTSIHASLRLIEGGIAGEVPAKVARLVGIARNESDRLIRLINDILDIRKLEAGRLELKVKSVEVQDLVDHAFSAAQGMAQEAEISLEHQMMFEGKIKCDHDRIVQILANFLSNAIKFSTKGSKVILDVERTKNMVRFSVSDEGEGIPEGEMHKLWGRFQQLDSSDTRQKGGTGLGLAISKGLAEQHGGSVGVASEVGRGTTFWVELPILENSARATASDLKSYSLARVLMVEDDQELSKLIKHMLRKEGFDLEVAGSLSEADELLKEFTPRAIILDIHLPDGNGLAWLRDKQAKNSQFAIPTVVLSGNDRPQAESGTPMIMDWLIKPVEDKQLERALRFAVRNKGAVTAKILIVEDDSSTRELIKHQVNQFPVEIVEAVDGPGALAAAKKECPDLIILDIGVPAPDGFDIIENLRKGDSKSTPLIIYTSRDLSKDEMNQLTLGLTKHLIKSRTSEAEFVDSVRLLLDGLLPQPSDSDLQKK